MIIVSILFACSVFEAGASERAVAEIKCEPSNINLSYHCNLRFKNRATNKPITGAKILIKADMPSMPMTHNLPPVYAQPGNMPGHYKANLKLEMYGEWALTIDISEPFRDRIVKKINFRNNNKNKYGVTNEHKINKHEGQGHSNHTKH